MPNNWTQFVKRKAQELNISYSCALSKPEISKEYKESKIPKPEPPKKKVEEPEPPKKKVEEPEPPKKKVEEPKEKTDFRLIQIKSIDNKGKIIREFEKVKLSELDDYVKKNNLIKEGLYLYSKSKKIEETKIDKELIKKQQEIKKQKEEEYRKKEEEYYKKQDKKMKDDNEIREKYRSDPENSFMYKVGLQDKIKITPKMEETYKNINLLMDYLKYNRKGMFKTPEQNNMYDTLLTAIKTLDFYPTPSEIGDYIAKYINDSYGFESGIGLGIMDMCCGLGSLSLPLINYMTEKDKLYLVDFYRPFVEILKGLESKNIIVRQEDILLSGSKYYDKRISIIISNPPFSIPYPDKDGRDKLGYFYFLFKALDILEEQKLNVEPTILFICPMTHFKTSTGDPPRKENEGDLCELKIPSATLKRIFKYLSLENKYEEDDDFYAQCKFLKVIDGFKTLRGGKPVDLGLQVGLFEFLVYRKNTIYGLGLKKKSKVYNIE